jgi:hypothetical protein
MLVGSVRVSLLIGVLLFCLIPLQVTAAQDQWWNDGWSFRQEILIPFDTGSDVAMYQPIDTTIVFTNPCWAKKETEHSVRVVCQWNDKDVELESQIYGLVQTDESHISSCNLVFLIPPEADGTERYFVYYDDAETTVPEYPYHVSIQDSSYFYEPIPGYPL